jgi:hypothetical protein
MEKKTTTRDLTADIECYLLKTWYLHYRGEFLTECERVGLKFMRDLVDPDDQERFTKAFDDLVALGCRPLLLASTLYCFRSSRIYDFPDCFPNDGKLVPRFLGFERMPTSKEAKRYMRILDEAAEVIEWLRYLGVDRLLSSHVKPPLHHDRVPEILRGYGYVLKNWSRPRSDVTRSFGPIACCIYAELATKHFQFPLVSELVECFGYKPDPKRQHAKGKYKLPELGDQQSRYEIAEELANDDPADQSLERNYRIFRAGHPKIYRELRLLIALDHEAEHTESPEAINWKEVFAPQGKYDFQRWRSPSIS